MAVGPLHLLLACLLVFLLGFASLQLQAWPYLKIQHGKMSRPAPQHSSKTWVRLKHNHLVLGAAAGQGMVGRVQCRGNGSIAGVEAITKTQLSTKLCLHNDKEKATFATVFVIRNTKVSDREYVFRDYDGNARTPAMTSVDKQYLIVNILLDSIKVSMPGTPALIISDPSMEIAKGMLPPDILVKPIPGNYTSGNLMLQRLQSYIALLDSMVMNLNIGSKRVITHVIFIDADTIMVDNVGCALTEHPHFDMALTFRNNLKQPINTGVIMIRGTLEGLSRGKALLEEVVKVYLGKYRAASGMMGDQQAFADVVGAAVEAHRFRRGLHFEAQVLGARVLFLPCALYNWTPSEGAGQFHGMPEEVKVLHFKGSRKRLMIEAWGFYKRRGSLDFSDMKCLVLQSGRYKYDF